MEQMLCIILSSDSFCHFAAVTQVLYTEEWRQHALSVPVLRCKLPVTLFSYRDGTFPRTLCNRVNLWSFDFFFSVMHVITAEHPPSQHNDSRYICKSVPLSGLRDIHMTSEHCGIVCISNWVFEVICFGKPGLNLTPWTLESYKNPLPGSWEKEGKLGSKFFAAHFSAASPN